MSSENDSPNVPIVTEPTVTCTLSAPPHIVGGIGTYRPVTEHDLDIWNMYKQPLEKQIRDQFKLSETDPVSPVQVATQVVAGTNYFFKVQLPNKMYAAARVYHIPWRKETHGQPQQVAVQAKTFENLDDHVGHF